MHALATRGVYTAETRPNFAPRCYRPRAQETRVSLLSLENRFPESIHLFCLAHTVLQKKGKEKNHALFLHPHIGDIERKDRKSSAARCNPTHASLSIVALCCVADVLSYYTYIYLYLYPRALTHARARKHTKEPPYL